MQWSVATGRLFIDENLAVPFCNISTKSQVFSRLFTACLFFNKRQRKSEWSDCQCEVRGGGSGVGEASESSQSQNYLSPQSPVPSDSSRAFNDRVKYKLVNSLVLRSEVAHR